MCSLIPEYYRTFFLDCERICQQSDRVGLICPRNIKNIRDFDPSKSNQELKPSWMLVFRLQKEHLMIHEFLMLLPLTLLRHSRWKISRISQLFISTTLFSTKKNLSIRLFLVERHIRCLAISWTNKSNSDYKVNPNCTQIIEYI